MDDLISRADIEWHDYLVADGNGMYHDEKIAYKSQIDMLPSAQTKRKEGRWIFETLDGMPGYRPTVMFCSKCGRVSIADYNYCPNCGARMGGEKE